MSKFVELNHTLRVAGVPGTVLDAVPSSDRSITLACDPAELRGRAALIRTGWDQRWGTDRCGASVQSLAAAPDRVPVRCRPAPDRAGGIVPRPGFRRDRLMGYSALTRA